MLSLQHIDRFRESLLEWSKHVDRPMPWKETRDPYKIWISEIILQQTRVKQGEAYYTRFINRFPTVQALSRAKVDDILSVWKGLGYYTRAINLHRASKQIIRDFGGVFPETYDDMLTLYGIGPYTAAAIASFAFDRPYAVLDGNVYRVLSRFFDLAWSIDGISGRQQFADLANRAMGNSPPSLYNQGIMNLGALVCKSRGPNCRTCPLSNECLGLAKGTVLLRPIKKPKRKRQVRHFHYGLFLHDDQILLLRRGLNDIWKNLYELPHVEGENLSTNDIVDSFSSDLLLSETYSLLPLVIKRQIITHQEIVGHFYMISGHISKIKQGFWVPHSKVTEIATPKIINDFLEEYLGGIYES